jgi:hypothetical protein
MDGTHMYDDGDWDTGDRMNADDQDIAMDLENEEDAEWDSLYRQAAARSDNLNFTELCEAKAEELRQKARLRYYRHADKIRQTWDMQRDRNMARYNLLITNSYLIHSTTMQNLKCALCDNNAEGNCMAIDARNMYDM